MRSKKLSEYSKCKVFIRRKIELLQCDTAVLYSTSSYKNDDIKEILHEAGVKHIFEINCHPSRYSKTKLRERYSRHAPNKNYKNSAGDQMLRRDFALKTAFGTFE